MEFGISNLAWNINKNLEVFEFLRLRGIKHIEIAPTKIANWTDTDFTLKLENFKELTDKYNLSICGLQSVFYDTDINIFSDNQGFIRHFEKLFQVCKILDAKYIVYGSPNSRNILNNQNEKIFIETFKQISSFDTNILICIEPIPKEYNCNFITNMAECQVVVNRIKKDNIKSHIDLAEIIINNENLSDFDFTICDTAHISSPRLKSLNINNSALYEQIFTFNLKYITLEYLSNNGVNDIQKQLKILNK